MKNITSCLEDTTHERIENIAQEQGIDSSQLIQTIMAEFVDRYDQNHTSTEDNTETNNNGINDLKNDIIHVEKLLLKSMRLSANALAMARLSIVDYKNPTADMPPETAKKIKAETRHIMDMLLASGFDQETTQLKALWEQLQVTE